MIGFRLPVKSVFKQPKHLVSATYANQDGIFKNGIANNDDYSILGRIDTEINEYISLGIDLNTAFQDRVAAAEPFHFLGMNRPTEPVYWPNGMPSSGIAGGNNPAVTVTDDFGYTNTERLRWIAKGSMDIIIPWVQGLGVDGYYYYTHNNNESKSWRKPWVTNSYNPYTQQYDVVNGGPTRPTLGESYSVGINNLVNLRVKYERYFGNHHLNTFIAAEQSTGQNNNFNAYRRDFPSSAIDQMFAGSVVGQSTGGSASESSRQNVFGRVSYNFQDKYLIDFNYRYDGSSNFPKEGRWGFFPGGSVAWNIGEENFLRDVASVTYLKLRASYGQIGNDAVPSFQWLSTYSIGSDGYPFGVTPSTTLGLRAGATPNPNITWEMSEISNIGLDATLWEGFLGMSVDVFKQKRSNILTRRDLAIPFHTGLELPNENIGVVENKGIEIDLSHLNRRMGEFTYRIGGNIAYARNKVIDVSEPAGTPEHQKQEGQVLGALLLYEAIGIFRTEEELEQYPVVPGTVVGDLMYKDFDGDGIITQNDMRRMSKTNTPEVTFGFNMSASYRDFSLWAHFSGQSRAWRQFHKHSKDGGHNSLKELLENRYTPGSMDSKYPIIPDSETQTMDVSGFPSTFWLRDASFVRLKTLELSYILPENLITRIGVSSMRIYINGQNLFTIDDLDWYDPEGDHLTGAFYPQNKIYNLGASVSF